MGAALFPSFDVLNVRSILMLFFFAFKKAIHFIGKQISNVVFSNVSSNSTGTFFLQLQTVVSASFENVQAVANGYAGVYNCEPAGANMNLTLIGDGNSGWSLNQSKCGFPPPAPPSPALLPRQAISTAREDGSVR